MIALLFLSTALAAEADIAPSGTVVTVRPESGEMATIIGITSGAIVADLPELPDPMWLVHPAAWRSAVALGEKVRVLEALPDSQSQIIANLKADVTSEKAMRSESRLQLEAANADIKMLRRSRTHWLVGGLVTGAVSGAAAVVVVVL